MYANSAQTQFQEIAKSASVKICSEYDVLLGSGFFVLPHVVLTCWHVIENSDTRLRLYTKKGRELNLQAAIEKIEIVPESDLALIHLKKDDKQAEQFCLWLDDKANPEHPCYTFGYSSEFENGDSILTSYVERVSDDRQWHKVKNDRITSGFSGSALINLRYGNALGVISESLDTNRNLGGVAIPTDVIFENFRWLKATQNDYFQKHLLWKSIKRRLAFDYEEVDGVERIDELFLAYQSESPQRAFIPDDFYLANPSAQWWGIIHDLAIDKSIFPAITESIATRFHLAYPIAAILYGSGGMGKSTTARKLLYHFHKDYECWWIDDQLDIDNCATFFEHLLPELLSDSQAKLLVLDDWGKLDEGVKRKFKSVFNQIRKQQLTQIKFIITTKSKNLENIAREWRTPDTDFHFSQDKKLLIDNERLVNKLKTNVNDKIEFPISDDLIAKAKPFHLLFILFRTFRNKDIQKKLFSKLYNAKGYFDSIIEHDIKLLYDKNKGLAYTMIFLAYVQKKFRRNISKISFLQMADYFGKNNYSYTENYQNKKTSEWKTLGFYLSEKKSNRWGAFLSISKDEFINSILKVQLSNYSAKEYLEECKIEAVNYLINSGSEASASNFAYLFSMKEKLLDKKAVLNKMVQTQNRNFDFLRILFESQEFSLKERIDWKTEIERYHNELNDLDEYSKLCWLTFAVNDENPIGTEGKEKIKNFIFSNRKSKIIKRRIRSLLKISPNAAYVLQDFILNETSDRNLVVYYIDRLLPNSVESLNIAEKILDKYNQDSEITFKCLKLLKNRPERAIPIAEKILYKTTSKNVVIICLKTLSSKPNVAKYHLENTLRKFIDKNVIKNQDIICFCLKRLSPNPEIALPFAKELLENQTFSFSEVTSNCLKIISKAEPTIAINMTQRLLETENSTKIICGFLEALESDTEVAILMAQKFIKMANSELITLACIKILSLEPDIAIPFAKEIIKIRDISIDLKITCLKIIETEIDVVVPIAINILSDEENPQGVICTCLRVLKSKPDTAILMARKFIESEYESVQCTCLRLLDETDKELAISFAKEIIDRENNPSSVICTCLRVLANRPLIAIPIANRFIAEINSPEVISACLKILSDKQKGREYAFNILSEWQSQNQDLVALSLGITSDKDVVEKVISEVVQSPEEYGRLYEKIVQFSHIESPSWNTHILEILNSWEDNKPRIVANSLNHYEHDLAYTKPICKGVLGNWRISVTREKLKPLRKQNFYFIFKTMAHPDLNNYTKEVVQEMLEEEAKRPYFLPRVIRERCYAIQEHNEFPEWISGLNANLPKEE